MEVEEVKQSPFKGKIIGYLDTETHSTNTLKLSLKCSLKVNILQLNVKEN